MLSKKFLQYRLDRLIKKKRPSQQSIAYKDAKYIGILFTSEDLKKHEAMKQLLKDLKKDGKKVEVMTMLPTGGQNFEFKFNFFTEKDISFWGSFNSPDVISFANQQFDYLFYVDFESTSIMRYILAQSNAKCRVGYYEETNRPVCELMVAPEFSTYESLINEMYKYSCILT